jgi:hypothetical protein
MESKDLERLQELFWEYCKTFDEYLEFNVKKFTREEILKDIESRYSKLKGSL